MNRKRLYKVFLGATIIVGLFKPLNSFGYSSDKYHGLVIDYSLTAAGQSDTNESAEIEICSGEQVRFDVELFANWDSGLKASNLREMVWEIDPGVDGVEPITKKNLARI